MRFIDFDSTGARTGKGRRKRIRIRRPHSKQTADKPALAFGDGDSGFWESADDVLHVGTNGSPRVNVDASGRVGIGITPEWNFHVGSAAGGHYFGRYSADTAPSTICLDKSRHATVGSHTVVQDNDIVGALIFKGSDGSAFRNAAVIRCDIDGTPGSSDMPGELLFQVTPDGSATSATAMTISPDKTVTLAGNLVVSGTTTTIDSTTLTVDDKNIELGSVASPSDTTADGGGITLKGATDKTISWSNSQDAWVYNQGITVGANDTGHDVTFYGAAAGAAMIWDESADSLLVRGATADAVGSSGRIVLQTAQVGVEAADILGRIDFQAPLEDSGTDAILVGASIIGIAEQTFHGSDNSTALVLATNTSDVATERMRITSAGNVGVGIDAPTKKIHSYVSDATDYSPANAATWATTLIQNGANYNESHAAGIGFSTVTTAAYDNNAVCGIAAVKASDGTSYGADLAFITRPGAAVSAERMRIDKDGKVGIATSAPERSLHTKGAAEVQALFENPSTTASQFAYVDIESNAASAGESIIRFKTPDGTSYINSKGSATTMTFSSGNVGIANTAPANKLWVQGGISATGDITSSASDERLKENRNPISNAVEKVLKLKGITYDWIDNISEVTGTEWNHTEKQAGLIAQDVQKVLPEAVSIAPFDKDGEGKSVSGKDYLTIDYARVVPLLVNAIKEQQEQIDVLKEELKNGV